MKVEIVLSSKEIIKPYSPTPHYLHKHQLSFLDQISPCAFMPLLYFYPKDAGINKERSTQLKKSLSYVLTRFYPLAGQMVDNLYINCNDRGVEFFEAEANTKLSEFMTNCDDPAHELNKFLPRDLIDVEDRCMAVQVNFFQCGGMALCLLISHKVADATCMYTFANSWAAVARGETEVPCPRFEAATLFPPRNIPDHGRISILRKDRSVTKNFLFQDSKIDALREKYTNINNNPSGNRPRRSTRVEALSTFLWTRFMASTQENTADLDKIYALIQIANIRTRFDPPLSEDYIGNMGRPAFAILSEQDQKEGGYRVVEKLREALSNMNGQYVARLQEGVETSSLQLAAMIKNNKEKAKEKQKLKLVTFQVSSFCRFPLYEADFGWGKPIWVTMTPHPFTNIAVFLDTKSGDGIEVWLSLKEEDMAKFEADFDLRQLITSKQLHYSVDHDQKSTQLATIPVLCSRL